MSEHEMTKQEFLRELNTNPKMVVKHILIHTSDHEFLKKILTILEQNPLNDAAYLSDADFQYYINEQTRCCISDRPTFNANELIELYPDFLMPTILEFINAEVLFSLDICETQKLLERLPSQMGKSIFRREDTNTNGNNFWNNPNTIFSFLSNPTDQPTAIDLVTKVQTFQS
jgi:hydroxymethylpyrimidine pyrophosphatase-like HAD family hydrolase